MDKYIKDLILKEFEGLYEYYGYKIKEHHERVVNLKISLIRDERETDINNKYSRENISHIKDIIKKNEEKVKEYTNRWCDCRRVLSYFEKKDEVKKNKIENDTKSKLENKLNKEFSDCNFLIKEDEYNILIIYSNRKYINDDEFLDRVLDIASEFLDEDNLWKIATVYDFDDEI